MDPLSIDRKIRRIDKMVPDRAEPPSVTVVFYDPEDGEPDTSDVEGTAVLFPTDVPEPDSVDPQS
jgi:hypothetical protein